MPDRVRLELGLAGGQTLVVEVAAAESSRVMAAFAAAERTLVELHGGGHLGVDMGQIGYIRQDAGAPRAGFAAAGSG